MLCEVGADRKPLVDGRGRPAYPCRNGGSGRRMADAAVILDSLEQAAGQDDPAERIFRRLFAMRPEFEAMFVLDGDGGVRGSMVQTCFESIIDHVSGGQTGRRMIAAERSHHAAYGVPDARFNDLFVAIRDELREGLGGAWTTAMEREWGMLLGELEEAGAGAG